jgi:hypothetical protein
MKSSLIKTGKPRTGNPREGLSRREQMIWLAGAIDWEGHICIERANPSGKYKRVRYWPIVSVSNTNRSALEKVKAIFDAPIYVTRKQDERRKEQWHWQASSREALKVITAVRPFLIIKGPQADAVIEYMAGVSSENRGIRLTDEEMSRRDSFYWKLRAMNAKGPPATTEREDTQVG